MTSGSSGSGRERRQPESSSQAGDGDPFPSSSHILLVSPFRPPLFLLRPSSLVPSSCPVLESSLASAHAGASVAAVTAGLLRLASQDRLFVGNRPCLRLSPARHERLPDSLSA